MKNISSLHSDCSRQRSAKSPSDRSFGFVFTIVFGLVGLWPLVQLKEPHWSLLYLAVITLSLASFRPVLLAPFNIVWTKFGLLLHKVSNPLIMGVIYFFVVTPTGLILRILRKDILNLKWNDHAKSYWVLQNSSGRSRESMRNQF
jgi:hypothetical protein